MDSVTKIFKRLALSTLGVAILFGALSSIGCTVHTNGMTLPSPDWLKQRPQYFPSGPQFPLSQEKAMMDAERAEMK